MICTYRSVALLASLLLSFTFLQAQQVQPFDAYEAEANGYFLSPTPTPAGIVVSAITFAMYHDFPTFGTLGLGALIFFGFAGVYLSLLYVNRGFGIAAGTHAAYDLIVTILLASTTN